MCFLFESIFKSVAKFVNMQINLKLHSYRQITSYCSCFFYTSALAELQMCDLSLNLSGCTYHHLTVHCWFSTVLRSVVTMSGQGLNIVDCPTEADEDSVVLGQWRQGRFWWGQERSKAGEGQVGADCHPTSLWTAEQVLRCCQHWDARYQAQKENPLSMIFLVVKLADSLEGCVHEPLFSAHCD